MILSIEMRATKAIRPFNVHFKNRSNVFGKFEFAKEIDCTGERAATPNGDSTKGAPFIYKGSGHNRNF